MENDFVDFIFSLETYHILIFENGEKKEEGNVKDGKKDGLFAEWDEGMLNVGAIIKNDVV